jgi:hypothetical protein
VNVSSYSRKVMQEMIYKAVDGSIPIYYSNTDCLLVREEDAASLFGPQGDPQGSRGELFPGGSELGDFALEHSSRKFICISPRKYIHCHKDGSYKFCYGPTKKNKDPEEYFDWLWALKTSQRDSP